MAEGKNVEQRVDSLETKFELYMKTQDERFNTFMNELQQQREDIRRLQDRQDAMQAKLEAEIKASQAKHEAEMHEMNQRFYNKVDENQKEFTKQLHTNFIQTMLCVGAIMAAIGGLIIAALK